MNAATHGLKAFAKHEIRANVMLCVIFYRAIADWGSWNEFALFAEKTSFFLNGPWITMSFHPGISAKSMQKLTSWDHDGFDTISMAKSS